MCISHHYCLHIAPSLVGSKENSEIEIWYKCYGFHWHLNMYFCTHQFCCMETFMTTKLTMKIMTIINPQDLHDTGALYLLRFQKHQTIYSRSKINVVHWPLRGSRNMTQSKHATDRVMHRQIKE